MTQIQERKGRRCTNWEKKEKALLVENQRAGWKDSQTSSPRRRTDPICSSTAPGSLNILIREQGLRSAAGMGGANGNERWVSSPTWVKLNFFLGVGSSWPMVTLTSGVYIHIFFNFWNYIESLSLNYVISSGSEVMGI